MTLRNHGSYATHPQKMNTRVFVAILSPDFLAPKRYGDNENRLNKSSDNTAESG